MHHAGSQATEWQQAYDTAACCYYYYNMQTQVRGSQADAVCCEPLQPDSLTTSSTTNQVQPLCWDANIAANIAATMEPTDLQLRMQAIQAML